MINLHLKLGHLAALRFWLALVLISCVVTSVHAQETTENKSGVESKFTGTQKSTVRIFKLRPIRTDSPRDTLKTFLRLRDDLEHNLHSYRLSKSRELAKQRWALYGQFRDLIDLSTGAQASRREIGLDSERGEKAAKEVESWRKAGKLPFPRLSADRIEQLEGTLAYPPIGSVEADTLASQVWETSEQLAAEPDDEDESDRKFPSQKRGGDS